MRIPPSVIVMSLLTAAPFGLAIRDTLHKKGDASGDDAFDFDGRSRARRDRAKALEEYEREAQREAEEQARKNEERRAKLDTLFGTTPASMGSLLAGIQLGADAGSFQPESARSRIDQATRDGFLNVSFDVDAKSLNAVTVEISGGYDYDSSSTASTCDVLRDKLGAAWGRTSGSTWLDPATHQRASLDPTTCRLTFDRYVDPTAWVTAVPLDAIGKPVDKLLESLGSAVETDDTGASWQSAGLGLGRNGTTLSAYFDKGKVVGIKATASCDFDTMVMIREEVSKRLGARPTRNADTAQWEWKRRPKVSLDESVDSFILQVGTIPWE